jgi:hypothetical protein
MLLAVGLAAGYIVLFLLSGLDILHLARGLPEFKTAYADPFRSIGGERMLEIMAS